MLCSTVHSELTLSPVSPSLRNEWLRSGFRRFRLNFMYFESRNFWLKLCQSASHPINYMYMYVYVHEVLSYGRSSCRAHDGWDYRKSPCIHMYVAIVVHTYVFKLCSSVTYLLGKLAIWISNVLWLLSPPHLHLGLCWHSTQWWRPEVETGTT